MKTAWINMWKSAMSFQCSCLAWRHTCLCEKDLQSSLTNPTWSFIEVWLISRKIMRCSFHVLVKGNQTKKNQKPSSNSNLHLWMVHNFFISHFEEFVLTGSHLCFLVKVRYHPCHSQARKEGQHHCSLVAPTWLYISRQLVCNNRRK